jgi:hypothetical protein
MVVAKDNNKVDTFNGMKKAELKEAMKKVIITLLEDKQPLNEAAAEKLEQYINYENSDNQDLAARIRKGATELAAHIAKIEKMYLDTREDIEAIYEDEKQKNKLLLAAEHKETVVTEEDEIEESITLNKHIDAKEEKLLKIINEE